MGLQLRMKRQADEPVANPLLDFLTIRDWPKISQVAAPVWVTYDIPISSWERSNFMPDNHVKFAMTQEERLEVGRLCRRIEREREPQRLITLLQELRLFIERLLSSAAAR